MVRALLVEDQHLLRAGMKLVLEATGEISVVVEASTGEETVRLGLSTSCDVILMDLSLPDTDGLSCIRSLRSGGCAVPILVVTAHTAAGVVRESFAAGAQGSVQKTSQPEELRRAVLAVAGGDSFVPEGISLAEPSSAVSLTTLEREALLLTARGGELATLGLSERTLASHMRSLFRKLGVATLEEGVGRARELGLILVDPHERRSL